MKNKIPRAPTELQEHGKSFWKSIHTDFEVADGHSLELLYRACIQLDRANDAREQIAAKGMTFEDRWGQVRANPAVEQERQAVNLFRLLTREMGMDVAPSEPRAPRRAGTGV
jgi:phage terminase small subunit